jgi:hypothetical protein
LVGEGDAKFAIVTFGDWVLDLQLPAEALISGVQLPETLTYATHINVLSLYYEYTHGEALQPVRTIEDFLAANSLAVKPVSLKSKQDC